MATAAQQRLRRTRIPEQMALEIDIPAALDLDDPSAHTREQDAFALIADDIANAQPRAADPWIGSPYAWFKRLPPARRGTTGQALLMRWLTHCGVPYAPRHGDGDYDISVGASESATRAQMRISTLWSGGDFIFQGIKAGEYDTVLLLAIAPHHVRLWAVPQHVALTHLDSAGWINVPGDKVPAWLSPYGGTLTAATRRLANRLP